MFNFAFNSRASWVTVHIDCTQNLGYLFSWCTLEIMEWSLHPGNLSLRALEATCGRGWVCPLPFVCCSWRSAAVHPPGWDATRVCSQGRRSGGAQLMPPGINCRRDFCSLSRKWIALPTSVEKKKKEANALSWSGGKRKQVFRWRCMEAGSWQAGCLHASQSQGCGP